MDSQNMWERSRLLVQQDQANDWPNGMARFFDDSVWKREWRRSPMERCCIAKTAGGRPRGRRRHFLVREKEPSRLVAN